MAWNDFIEHIIRGNAQSAPPPVPVPTPTPPMLPPSLQPSGLSDDQLLGLLAAAMPAPKSGGGGFLGGLGNAVGGVIDTVGNAGSAAINTVGNVGGNVIDTVGDAGRWYYNTERDLLGKAANTAKPVVNAARDYGVLGALGVGQQQLLQGAVNQAPSILPYLDKPRQQVISDMGQQAYYMATHEGKIPNGGFSWDPYLTVSNLVGAGAGEIADLFGSDDPQGGYAFLTGWAKDPANWEVIKNAYENGYTQMVDSGQVDENGDPIMVAGEYFPPGPRAVWEAYIGTTGIVTRVAADMSFDPLNALGGVGQIGKRVQGVGEVVRGAEDASRTRRAAGTALDLIGQAGQAPEAVLNAPGEAIIGSIGAGAKQVAKLPGVRTVIAPAAATIRRREGGAVNEALQQLRGSDAMDTLISSSPGGGIAGEATSALDRPVSDGVQDATQVINQAATPTPRSYVPGWDAVPEYLRPTNEGERLIDILARENGASNPEGTRRFIDRYAPLAEKHASTMDAIEAKYRKASKPRWVPEKTIAMARHIVDDLMPIAREELGDVPAYRFMQGDGLDEALNVARGPDGKVANWREIAGMAPNPSNVIEQAVFGTDDLAASNARLWMRQQPQKGWRAIADESKRLRSELYGEESVASGLDIQAKRAAKDAEAGIQPGQTDLLPDGATRESTDARWMAEQEAKALREAGQPIPDDLQAMLDQPITPETPAISESPAPLADPVYKAVDPVPDGVDPALADQGWHNPDTEVYDKAMTRAVEVGDLTLDQAQVLSEKHLFNENGQRIKAPKPGRERTRIDAAGNVIVEPATEQVTHSKSAIEIYTELLNSGMDAGEARRRVVDMIGSMAGNRTKLGRALRAYDTASSFIRETLMFNPITGWRGIFSDQIGDTWSLVQKGDTAAAIDSFRNALGIWGKSRRGELLEEYLAKTSGGKLMDKIGAATPTGLSVEVGREEVGRDGAMTLNRAIRKITGSERAGNAVGGLLQTEYIRDVRTALDRVRRFSVFDGALNRLLPSVRDDYFAIVRQAAEKEGIDGDAIIAQLGDAFDPRAVRQTAIGAGMKDGTAEQLARQWRSRVNQMQKTAMEDVNSKLFSYEATNADEITKRAFLFHFWLSRASVQYMENAVRNPRIALAYYRAAQGLENEARGKPRSVAGFLKLMNGGAGYSLFFNPVALASTALLFRDQAYADGDGSTFDRLIQNSGGFLNPLLQTALTATGLSGEVVDPTATYSIRNTIGGIVQWGVGNGYLEPVGVNPQYLGTPYQGLINRAFAMSSGLAAKVLPMARQFTPDDPDGTTQAMIQADIAQQIRDAYELGDTTIDAWPQQAQQDYLDAISAFQLGKSGNQYADQAVKNYSNANVVRRGFGAIVPGGVSMRSDVRDQTMLAANAGDQNAIQNRNLFNPGSPEAAALEVASQNVNTVGRDWTTSGDNRAVIGRDANAMLNGIVYGDHPQPIRVGGTTYSTEQLLAMTEDERKALASQWLLGAGLLDDRSAYFNARDDVVAQPINQVYAGYQDWSSTAREIGMEKLMKMSPAYRAYIEGLSPETRNDPARLAGAAFSTDAYMAANGIKGSVYTSEIQQPLLDPTQVSAVDVLSGGGGGQSKPPKTREQQLVDSMNDYQIRRAEFDQLLQQYTGNPHASLDSATGANPMLANAIMTNLRAMGIDVPSIPREVQQYLDWSAMQPNGADTSPAAYYRWVDSTVANHGIGQAIPATAP